LQYRELASCLGIFAHSLLGLLFAGIGRLCAGAFVVGIGLLLDAFMVRTITANWWPSRLGSVVAASGDRAVSPWPARQLITTISGVPRI
jgi:uncharacterized membrane protein YdfJ with MMPL/SSD domain